MQIIIGIFVLGGIILPFILKILDKTAEGIDKAADAIEPDSILGKIENGFILLLVLAYIIFLAY